MVCLSLRKGEGMRVLQPVLQVIVAAVLIACQSVHDPMRGTVANEKTKRTVGDFAPNFQFTSPDGQSRLFNQVRGDITILGFTESTILGVCTLSADLLSLARKYSGFRPSGYEVEVKFIDINEPVEGAGEHPLEKCNFTEIHFIALIDSNGSVMKNFGATNGAVYIVDHDGRISWIGSISNTDAVSKALEETIRKYGEEKRAIQLGT
jgi:alkyl hydroperoxide reductase subunit AhpC